MSYDLCVSPPPPHAPCPPPPSSLLILATTDRPRDRPPQEGKHPPPQNKIIFDFFFYHLLYHRLDKTRRRRSESIPFPTTILLHAAHRGESFSSKKQRERKREMETFFFFQKISSTRFFSLRISHPPFCTRAPVPFYFLSLIIINLEVLRPIRKPLYTVPLSFHPQKKIGVVVVSQNQPKQKKPLSPCNELLSLPPPPNQSYCHQCPFFSPSFFIFFCRLPKSRMSNPSVLPYFC